MADPLSLAAGIAGLFGLTVQVIHIVNKFEGNVGTVSKDVEALVQELIGLKGVLEKLETAWKEKKLPSDFDLSALAGVEKACEEQLTTLLDRLNKAYSCLQKKSTFGIRRTALLLQWPFEVGKTRGIVDNLHRYFSIFDWALHFYESEILLKVSKDACKILQGQDKMLDQLRRLFENSLEIRHRIDAATYITNSALKAIEGKLSALGDDVREDLETVKARTVSLAIVEDIHRDVKESKEKTYLLGEDVRRVQSEIIENYNREQAEKLLDRLPTVPYLEKHRHAIEGHQPGTGQWFLKDFRFTSWKNDATPSVLLCQGMPGAGKTILTGLSIEDALKESGEDTHVAYVYCDYRNHEKETVLVLLWSLLRQLMTPERVIFPFVRSKCLGICTSNLDTDSKINEIVILIRILSNLSQKTYLFVDGIDEVAESDPYGKDVRQRLLAELYGLADTCRIFVTCRPHICTDHLHHTSRYRTIEIRAANNDISAYVDSSISASKTLRDFVTNDISLRYTIIDIIQKRSNGVFLLARFHVSQIAAAVSPRDVLQILESLSGNLSEVYGSFWKRLSRQHLNRRTLAKRALSWVLRTFRPLTDVELAHALSFKSGDNDLQPSGLIDISMIIEVCDGLLRLESPTSACRRPVVSFAHSTIAEFLDQITGSYDAHIDIANTSLSYLGLRNVTMKEPFFSYDESCWAVHAKLSRVMVDPRALLSFARNSLEPLARSAEFGLDYALDILLNNGFPANESYGAVTPLMLSASHGHTRCLTRLLKARADVNYVSETPILYNTALLCATAGGHLSSVSLLIEAGANLDVGHIPPIITAVTAGHCNIAEKLLSAGSNANIKYECKTALYRALELDNPAMTSILISGGADVDVPSTTFQITPLQLATNQRQWSSAMALITHGADPTRKTQLGLDPLQQATYEGSFDVADAILRASSFTNQQHNKDANSTRHMSKSPLHLALEARHRDVAKLLIRNGIGVNNICGTPPYTPLEWAAKQNDSELVEELLAANADPNLFGESIPLLSAASRFVKWENVYDFHDTAVIALLLDAGANPHAVDCTFVEPLEKCIEENTRNKWWRKDDPTIWRLRVALALPEDWVAL